MWLMVIVLNHRWIGASSWGEGHGLTENFCRLVIGGEAPVCHGAGVQCGGLDFTGDTKCCEPLECVWMNDDWSECRGETPTPPQTPTPTRAPTEVERPGPTTAPWRITVRIVGDEKVAEIDMQELADNFKRLFKAARLTHVTVCDIDHFP